MDHSMTTYQVKPHDRAGWVGRFPTAGLDFMSACRTADRRGVVYWGSLEGYEAMALLAFGPIGMSDAILQAWAYSNAAAAEADLLGLCYSRMLAEWWRLTRDDAPDLWRGAPPVLERGRGRGG